MPCWRGFRQGRGVGVEGKEGAARREGERGEATERKEVGFERKKDVVSERGEPRELGPRKLQVGDAAAATATAAWGRGF